MKKVFIFLGFLTTISCANHKFKKSGALKTKSKIENIKSKEKEILFIPMEKYHIGRIEYYEDLRNKIDSLQKLNYTVFYEGVTLEDKKKDSTTNKISLLKFRKIVDFFPLRNKGNLDIANNIIRGKFKYKGKHKLLNQPKYKQLKIDSLNSLRADVSIAEMIINFEENYEEIRLGSCDYETNFTEIYKCKKSKRSLRKKFRQKSIVDFRNKYLAEKINSSIKNKILVVYGGAHLIGLKYELQLLERNYD